MTNTKTIFEKSQVGQHAYSLPKDDPAFLTFVPLQHLLRRQEVPLPEVSEIDLTRHFSLLARRNVGIDTLFYPLGSCTMKLNPRVNEYAAALPGFTRTHPLAPDEAVQGNLTLIFELIQLLCEISGMEAGSLLPNAGAQGEFAGIRMIAAYHQKRGDTKRTEILIPTTPTERIRPRRRWSDSTLCRSRPMPMATSISTTSARQSPSALQG